MNMLGFANMNRIQLLRFSSKKHLKKHFKNHPPDKLTPSAGYTHLPPDKLRFPAGYTQIPPDTLRRA